ncbi:MAG: hypothetical protein Q7T80_14075 [Methanoregula sp.]|nr:hypothetical protein [Methanoregula sp.]
MILSMTAITHSIRSRRFIAGILSWLVPFLVAVPFYGRDGTLAIDLDLFKSIMIVVSSITAAILIIWFFRSVHASYTREAVITGLVWLGMNWALDAIVLVGLLGMPPADYFTQIGIRYLMIPAIVIAAGIVADEALLRNEG